MPVLPLHLPGLRKKNYNYSINNKAMKKKILITVVLCLTSLVTSTVQATKNSIISNANSQDSALSAVDEFGSNLTGTYVDFDTAKTYLDMVSSSNRVKLITAKWNDQWLAQYYTSYMLTVLSFIEKDASKRDAYIDEAETYFKMASLLYNKSYDELFLLAAMIANARLAVKPGSRYKKYGEIFNSNIDSAKKLNPGNPRIYYLQGNSIFYTPKLFGGGAKKAMPYFEKADTLFQSEKGGEISRPYWGKKQNTDMLRKCKD
jgi:hypothetical protein